MKPTETIDDKVSFKLTQDRLIHLYALTKGKVPLSVVTLQYWDLVNLMNSDFNHDSKRNSEGIKEDVYKHLMGIYLRDYQ